MITTLKELKNGSIAVVKDIQGGRALHHRLGRLGVHPSDKIRVVRNGFFGGPVLIEVHGTEVGIGQGMAERIVVETEGP
ncbi:MAG: ferrous iron transport protein A [Deltaproteobacteria bacterium]|nr:ferrous iron transport protein A [Deltaproteobacteria bacterium]